MTDKELLEQLYNKHPHSKMEKHPRYFNNYPESDDKGICINIFKELIKRNNFEFWFELGDAFITLLNDNIEPSYWHYNGNVAKDIYNILKEAATPNFYVTEIAEKLELSETHVELIQYILCEAELLEYGISPRGSWITEKGKRLLEYLDAIKEQIDKENKSDTNN